MAIQQSTPDMRAKKIILTTGASSGFGRMSVVDPIHDGADVGFAATGRLRAEMLHRTGPSELLVPAILDQKEPQ